MKKTNCILLLFSILLSGCESGDDVGGKDGVYIRLSSESFERTRVVDADNLAVEQTILNISVLLTEPGSDAITNWYVNAGFTTADDYRLVTLPEEPAVLQTKDIYVVTNYTVTDLSTITTISQLQELTTPVVNKTDNLDPAKGFSMYGMTGPFDFTSGETADVYVRRTCAKIRVTMTFPDEPGISTDNEFLIGHAAGYTYLTDHTVPLFLPVSDYFNFATNLPLADNGNQSYSGIAYVYEAADHPVLYLYTHLEGSAEAQEYSAELPIPERNHLYDCDVRIYTAEEATRAYGRNYIFEATVTGYDENGTATDHGTTIQRITF